MKYFLDTEFIEGFHKPLFGKKRHHIDLISIALVCEDGSSFYAISNEYSYKDASQWVKDNVILPLYRETVHGGAKNHFDVCDFHKHYGRSNKEIMCDLLLYIWRHNYEYWLDSTAEFIGRGLRHGWVQSDGTTSPEIYGYYADYDWVLFCSLFGTMMDLPAEFPMYCRDLKQMLDDKVMLAMKSGYGSWLDYKNANQAVLVEHNFEQCLNRFKEAAQYPKQKNEHSALEDAKWNKALYEYISLS